MKPKKGARLSRSPRAKKRRGRSSNAAARRAKKSPEERALARLAGTGHLRLADRRPQYRPSPLRAQPGLAMRLMAEDRGESMA